MIETTTFFKPTRPYHLDGRAYKLSHTGIFYPPKTPDLAVACMETSRVYGIPIRLVYADPVTGIDDFIAPGDMGIIAPTDPDNVAGLSCPGRSDLAAIRGERIARIFSAVGEIYRHPKYRFPNLLCRPTDDGAFAICHGQKVVSCHWSLEEAEAVKNYLLGYCFEFPLD